MAHPAHHRSVSLRSQASIDSVTASPPNELIRYDAARDAARMPILASNSGAVDLAHQLSKIPLDTTPVAGDSYTIIFDYRLGDTFHAVQAGANWTNGKWHDLLSTAANPFWYTRRMTFHSSVAAPQANLLRDEFTGTPPYFGANVTRAAPVEPNSYGAWGGDHQGVWTRFVGHLDVVAPTSSPVSTWSIWLLDEQRSAVLVIDQLDVQPAPLGTMKLFFAPKPLNPLPGDTAIHLRNVVVLHNYGTRAAVVADLLVPPVP